jgi:MFS transporter, DHA1 family, multidrug resistance protein
VIAPLVMDSTRSLALTSLLLMSIGLVAWLVVKLRWPETGRLHTGAAWAPPA